jgi:hypothetical protein
MNGFRFSLVHVLEWYEKQLQLEENRLAECHTALENAQRALSEARATRCGIEHALIHCSCITAGELTALESFRRKSRNHEKRLVSDCDASQSKLQAQLVAVKLVQRKVRLLEKLRERRLAEHSYAANRELEELAADTFLAKFARQR